MQPNRIETGNGDEKDQNHGSAVNTGSDGCIGHPQHHINVNAIAPAFIETPLTEPMLKDPTFNKYVLENTPLGRVGKPKDVSFAAVFLASEASAYVTGHILLIDGDWTAH
jgi:NAD(P)-dependent dehydrogenase (short-subunit alcohol dehydrogenase family)